jgi:ABC-type multidrug transport system fused ATPase/permease subunit
LSTVRTADVIYGLKEGRVHEFGTHDELMEKEGIYYHLVTNQVSVNRKINDEGDYQTLNNII